jgi:hypothetical protein
MVRELDEILRNNDVFFFEIQIGIYISILIYSNLFS